MLCFQADQAGIAQLVEHNLAKVGVASSNLVSRSIRAATSGFLLLKHMLRLDLSARVVELVDTQDLKSCDRKIVWVQVPSRVLQ